MFNVCMEPVEDVVPDAPEEDVPNMPDVGEDVPDVDPDTPDVVEDAPDVEDEEAGCEGDESCLEGQICVEEACVEGCREDEACADEAYCDLETLTCAEGCRIGACPEGEVCDRDTRTCLEIPCENDEGCDEGQICEAGLCTDGCRGDEGCLEGQICLDDVCVEGCREDEACDSDEICEDDVCVEGCREDEACGSDEICEGGACVLGCRRDEGCADDEYCDLDALSCDEGCRVGACPEGQACDRDTRACLEIPCENDGGCDEGQICEGGLCTDGCRGDEGCLEFQICLDEVCVEGCREDVECDQGQICEGNVCADGCRQDIDCGGGNICEGAQCVEGCRQDPDCGLFEVCEDEVCVERTCAVDEDCVQGTYCDEGLCLPGCRNDFECGENFVCDGAARQCQVGCRLDSECGEGNICEELACITGCRGDGQCAPEEICTERTHECITGCRLDTDCADDAYCEISNANPTEGVCQLGCRLRSCPEGQICGVEVRQCAEVLMCFDDEECGEGEICDLFCIQGCRGDEGCPDGQLCNGDPGFCEVGCRQDGDCSNGQFCSEVSGVCEGGCRGDEECGVGRRCVEEEGQRVCVQSPCESDDACDSDFFCDVEEGLCVLGCQEGACPVGLVCNVDVRACVPAPCESDDVCGVGEICVEGACEIGCRDDDACREGTYCDLERGDDAGVCLTGCRVGSCPQGLVCDTFIRFCSMPVCEVDDDCGEGQYCRDGVICDFGCRDDGECGDGEICEDFERVCTQGCRDEDDDDDVCGDVVGNPVDLPVGQNLEIEGQLCLGDVDHISVNLVRGELLTATIIRGGGVGELTPALLSDDCETIVAEAGFEEDPNRIGFFAPEDGTYVLRVSPSRPFDTNTYIASLERAPSVCLPDSEEPNEVNDGTAPVLDGPRGEVIPREDLTLCLGDEDWFSVELDSPGDAISATITQVEGQVPLRVEIRTADDVVLDVAEGDALTKTALTGPLNQPGVFFIRVSATDDVPVEGIDYDLEVLVNQIDNCVEDSFEPNDNPASPVPIEPGAHDLTLCQGRNDAEWFRIELLPGDIFNITMAYDHAAIEPEEQLSVTVFGPGGFEDLRDFTLRDGESDIDRLAFSPGGILVNEQDAGEWVISVESGPGGETIEVEMEVFAEAGACDEDDDPVNESCEEAIRLETGQSLTGYLCGPSGDEDWFVVTPDDQQGLQILLEHIHFQGNLELEAYAEDGVTLLGFSYNAGPDLEDILLFPVPDGDVCIRVFATGFQTENSYTISTELD